MKTNNEDLCQITGTDEGFDLSLPVNKGLTFTKSASISICMPYNERVMKDFYFVMQDGSFSMNQHQPSQINSVSLYCTTPLSNKDIINITVALGDENISLSEEDSLYLSDIICDLRAFLSFYNKLNN